MIPGGTRSDDSARPGVTPKPAPYYDRQVRDVSETTRNLI
jgi:hypothetical protein